MARRTKYDILKEGLDRVLDDTLRWVVIRLWDDDSTFLDLWRTAFDLMLLLPERTDVCDNPDSAWNINNLRCWVAEAKASCVNYEICFRSLVYV